ncbi:hypothetical protein HNR23_001014 [Nocardiopsis mwathae]|uniref:Uncharacterized protein n=1 Tax=Nocardiopsis mwathae TaxID=1472723 RepID=A0A7W9YF64_9ACTN|nr:hypothetical protein [Nocardiopsis mwathae]MBB6170954.1 hypothetical protein [Nocardiopsis mwathae]
MRARHTGERLWVCRECDAVWREGDDLSDPPFSSVAHDEPEGGVSWDDFHPVADAACAWDARARSVPGGRATSAHRAEGAPM